MKKIVAVIGLGLLVAIGLLLFVVGNFNSTIKNAIELVGSEILQVPVTVESVDISFRSGKGRIEGLYVRNPKGYTSSSAFILDRLDLELDVESLKKEKIHLKELVIDSPSIQFEGNFTNNNLKQLQKNVEAYRSRAAVSNAETGQVSEDAAVRSIRLDHLVIKNSKVGVAMSFLKDKPLSVHLAVLELVDLGKDQDLSISDVLKTVLLSLNRSTLHLIRQSVDKIEILFVAKGAELQSSPDDRMTR